MNKIFIFILFSVITFISKADIGNIILSDKQVKSFLNSNGFINNRNNDYINIHLGIILEDLHDENVLTRNGVLYFIDTVFYTTDEFWLTQ